MPYQFTVESRGWITCIALAAACAIVVWLVTYSICFVVFPGLPLVWAGKCVVMNRKWHGRVEKGQIVWESFFRRRPRVIPTLEISTIEIHHDEGTPFLVFSYRNGKWRRAPSGIYKFGEHEQFIAAVLEENPSIVLKHVS